ncbi:MAG TPA: glycosyltransferase family 2 protein [Salinimicrobium sp.]|nr:glycosyltransferase family 2 protein [Salinimicrobium sp.]
MNKTKNTKAALLISTYNWPEALELIFKSLKLQSCLPGEILIADDGSGEVTRKLIKKYKEIIPVPINHVWQEDTGFRKSAILNKAIAETIADYIIQVDGDCILHKNFVEDHVAVSQKNTYLYGSRVNIKPVAVQKIFAEDLYEFPVTSKHIKNKTRNLRIPIFQRMYKPENKFSSKTRGCNLSYWRKDFLDVNGYNEDLEGWGREDSEFILRMLNNGVEGKRLRYGGILYHIHHPQTSKERLAGNDRIQKQTIREKRIWCKNGVDKYLIHS